MKDYLDDGSYEEYFYKLVLSAPTVEVLLSNLQQCNEYQMWLKALKMAKINDANIIPLSESECNMLLDPDMVVWNKYHTSILESVSNHQDSNEHNSAIRSKKYINDVENAADWLKRSYPESIANYERKRTFWTSCIVFLASEFKSCLALLFLYDESKHLEVDQRSAGVAPTAVGAAGYRACREDLLHHRLFVENN